MIHDFNEFHTKLSNFYGRIIYPTFKFIFLFNSIASFVILLWEYGYEIPKAIEPYALSIIRIIVAIFLLYEFANLFFYKFYQTSLKEYLKIRKLELILALIVFILILFEGFFISYFFKTQIVSEYIVLTFLSIPQFLILINNFFHFSRFVSNIQYKALNPSLVFVISFLFVIVIGFILLSSPKTHNRDLSWVDIFFIVVSATCVTGLSPLDISKDFNLVGQIIILVLIQIGGLGLMTLTSFFSYYLAGQVSLTNQIVVKELFSDISLEKAKRTLRDVVIFTFIIESIGAIFLYFSLPDQLIPKGKSKIFYAIFHSVSAFCNAGFSLFPDSLFSVHQYSFFSIYTIMTLIVLGGLGFPTIKDIFNKARNHKYRFSLTTKIIFLSNGILWLSAFLVFFLFSYFYKLNFTLSERILHSLFFSITPRTAGFNILSYSDFPLPLIFFTFLLMWVGANPISTGGGIKTTTLIIAILHISALIRGKKMVEIFRKRISEETIIRAYTNVLLSLMTIFIGIFLISIFEKIDFLKITFEVVSAYGTVGLSMGITSDLTSFSKIILSIIMFIGRIGILTFLLAIMPKIKKSNYQYPTEYVIVS
ncbi:MAG: potassium transporter TrkG [Leptospiraceae bacterium]|nr:potassium transporter TrkG [Leptospiraceae bacterium]